MERPYLLSCHCGAVRLEVDAELGEVLECNCSTCRRAGMLHWYVPVAAVRLLTEKAGLSTYVWRFAHEGGHFCPNCGTHMYRTGYPDQIMSVNARAIEGVDMFALKVRRYDGRADMPPGVLP